MNKYLKMADVFELPINEIHIGIEPICVVDDFDDGVIPHEYAVHAINNHDALVAENERLRDLLKQCLPYIKDRADWGYDFEVNLLTEINKATGEAE